MSLLNVRALRVFAGLTTLAIGLALAPAAGSASSDLRLLSVHGLSYPDVFRGRLVFTGGRLSPSNVFATDPNPLADGRAVLRVKGARGVAPPLTLARTTIRTSHESNRLVVRVAAPPRRFKYFGYRFSADRQQLRLELWRNAPPVSPAPVGAGRCLVLKHWTVGSGTATVSGTERGLFEHMFVVRLRNLHGAVVATRSVAALAGHWQSHLTYHVGSTQAGTLEAIDTSEGDGSLVCLAQVRVKLLPT
jgi:Immunoglobulin-like domain of bacterial spore germination